MRIVVFGGTTEGRALSHLLAELGAEVTVSVATAYGREEQGVQPGITVTEGRRNREEMVELLHGASLCVDATHPYAVEASANIRAACALAGVPYRRLVREPGSVETGDGHTVTVDDAAEAASFLSRTAGNILLASGAKELSAYDNLDPARLFPRILPTHEGLSACEALGIPHRNILAMQGPFSRELNEALLRQYRIAYLVTKDGGGAGGFPEKVQAARNTGATLIVLRRPAETGNTFEEIASECKAMLRGTSQDSVT